MIKILSCRPQQMPRHRALIRAAAGIHYGWTGFEEFGVVWPFRYYGWRVTCWATVMARAYSDANLSLFFDRLETAADELNYLMDVADKAGALSKQPVKYWEPKFLSPPPIWFDCGLSTVEHQLHWPFQRLPGSPAWWRHWSRLHPEGGPLTDDMARWHGGAALIYGRLLGYRSDDRPQPRRRSKAVPARPA